MFGAKVLPIFRVLGIPGVRIWATEQSHGTHVPPLWPQSILKQVSGSTHAVGRNTQGTTSRQNLRNRVYPQAPHSNSVTIMTVSCQFPLSIFQVHPFLHPCSASVAVWVFIFFLWDHRSCLLDCVSDPSVGISLPFNGTWWFFVFLFCNAYLAVNDWCTHIFFLSSYQSFPLSFCCLPPPSLPSSRTHTEWHYFWSFLIFSSPKKEKTKIQTVCQ